MKMPRLRWRVSIDSVLLAATAVLVVMLGTALVITSMAAASAANSRTEYVMATESQASNVAFTERDLSNLVFVTLMWLENQGDLDEVQVARSLLNRRLNVAEGVVTNPVLQSETLLAALGEMDQVLVAAAASPDTALSPEQRSRLEQSLRALNAESTALVSQYQASAELEAVLLAQVLSWELRRLSVLTALTIIASLLFFGQLGRMQVRRNRKAQKSLQHEQGELAEARERLDRAGRTQTGQAAVLAAIAEGTDIEKIIALVVDLASLSVGSGVVVMRCDDGRIVAMRAGTQVLVDEENLLAMPIRWARVIDRMCLRNSQTGYLEIRSENLLDELALEEAAACVNLINIAITRDITAQALIEQARHDALTGLPNRMTLLDDLDMVLKQRSYLIQAGRELETAILFLDLDHFKDVNDNFGHDIGDQLLQLAVSRIKRSAGSDNQVYRLAGDEFVIVCPKLDSRLEPRVMAERIISAISERFELAGTHVWVGGSVGIAFAHAESSPVGLLHEADLAMYSAKQSGRSRAHEFHDELALAANQRLHMSKELGAAVDRNEFLLDYQPIVDVASSRVASYEALIRWNRPGQGIVSPGLFLPVAHETKEIIAIGRWVLGESARTLASWRAMGMPTDIRMSVNVAALQLRDPGFVDEATRIITAHGVTPKDFILELTEEMLIDRETAQTVLPQIHAAGFALALDDFGTGYSSLTQLEALPIDVVKVDREFVTRLAEGRPQHLRFLRALAAMVRSLGLDIVIEGIETDIELEAFTTAGYSMVQGYFYAKPQPANSIAASNWSVVGAKSNQHTPPLG